MISRYWTEFALNNLAAWYVTYLLYSTVVLGGLAVCLRLRRTSAATENALWRTAVVALPVLACVRILAEHVEFGAAGAAPQWFSIVGTRGWTLIYGSVTALLVSLVLLTLLAFGLRAERSRMRARRVTWHPSADVLRGWAHAARLPVPRLTECPGLLGPVAIGRREICVPEGMFGALPEASTRAVLAHEFGHIQRGDAPWGAAMHVLNRLFFLQPLHFWASRRIRETAEFLADDFAVRRTGQAEPLVTALTAFARKGSRSAQTELAHFVPGSLLLRRVRRVLNGGGPADESVNRLALGALLAAGLFILWTVPAVVPACDCVLTGL